MSDIEQQRRILVTGGAGFIGTALVRSLLSKGYRVTALDNFCTSHPSSLEQFQSHSNFTFVQADVTEPFPDFLRACRIYHLACPASPLLFAKRPLEILETCYRGTRNVLEAAHRWNARVLLASTSEVYGQPARSPQGEEYRGNVSCFGPRACYDEGKRIAETIAYAYRAQFGVDFRIARIFNTYGPGMLPSDGRVVCTFVGKAINGEDLVITGDGKATRSFQYVDDCVSGLRCLMESDWTGGPVNIGNEAECTIQELAEYVINTVSSVTGRPKAGIRYAAPPPDDPTQRKPDCSLARDFLGWKAQTSLAEGLHLTIQWHLSLANGMVTKRTHSEINILNGQVREEAVSLSSVI